MGPPTILVDKQPIKVDTRKAIALLAYLAVSKTRQRRDTLISLLYPDYDPTRAHTNFRRTLYALRKNLPETALETDWESVGIQTDAAFWVDVNQFKEKIKSCLSHGHASNEVCPACINPLSEAITLYKGDFLSGFTMKDSVEFDRWQFQQADNLRLVYFNAIELLVTGYQALGDFKASIRYAKQWQVLDPLNEKTHRKLMQLYAWSGQRSAAIRQYQECERILLEELNILPDESTTSLFKEITQSQGLPLPPESAQTRSKATGLPTHSGVPTIRRSMDSRSKTAGPAKTICVARELELIQLDRSFEAMLAGQGRPSFVIGGAGQGKTNLVQEFALRAQERSVDLLYAGGNCNAFSGFGDPYLPFREILRLLTGDVDALWAAGTITQEHTRRLWDAFPLVIETIVNFGPDLIDTFIAGRSLTRRAAAYMADRTSDQSNWLLELEKLVTQKASPRHELNLMQADMLEQYTRVMINLSQEKPILITLDDLQWADNGSISLLFHLGRRLAGRRIMIVCAYRPEEIAIGRAGERHPLEPVIHEFQRMYDDITIDLSFAENRSFVDAYLDREPNHLDAIFRDTIYRKTEGHPLFTIELLQGMEERGALIQDEEGYWIEGESLDWDILPSRIEAVIAERISRLDDSLKEILRVACVEGEIFSAEVIAHVLSFDEHQVVEFLSTHLEHKHQLVRAQEIQRLGALRLSRYRFRHFLFQNYLYHSLDTIERAHLHEAIGLALESLYQETPEDIAISLSRHFQEAGIIEKATQYIFLAGEEAIRRSDHETAITLYTHGLEMLKTLPQTPERDHNELQFLIALGLPLVLTKGHSADEVEKTYLRAKELGEKTGDNLQQFQILLGLRRYYLHRGDIFKAGELGDLLLPLVQDMPNSMHISRAHFMQAEIFYRMGQFSQTLEQCKKGITTYNPTLRQEHIVIYGNDCGIGCQTFEAISLWHLGYPEQARVMAEDVLSSITQLSHPFTLVFGLYFIANIYMLRREMGAVQKCIDELLDISYERDFAFYTACGSILKGWVMAQGDALKEGLQTMQKGLALWQDIKANLMLPTFLILISEVHGRAGHIDEGIRLINQANAIMQATGELTYEAELHRCKAELLLQQGNQQSEAERYFHKALEVARSQNARSWELRSAVSLVRLWIAQNKKSEAQTLLSSIYGWFTEGFDTPDLQEAKELLDRLLQ